MTVSGRIASFCLGAVRKAAQFRHISARYTRAYPGYDRLGEEAGRTILRLLAGLPDGCYPYVVATASISTRAPDGSAETSIVARAGGASPTCRAYTSFIPAKSSRSVR